MACGILILQLGFDHALAVTAPGPNHWTARGFPTALPFQGAAGVFSVAYDMVTILTIPRLLWSNAYFAFYFFLIIIAVFSLSHFPHIY